MVRTHEPERSPTPSSEPSLLKRMKRSHISSNAADSPEDQHSHTDEDATTANATAAASSSFSPSSDPETHFASELFSPNNIHRLHMEYVSSEPFRHVIVEKLFQDELLKKVKDEALSELSFSEKETDIYKVRRFPSSPHPSRSTA